MKGLCDRRAPTLDHRSRCRRQGGEINGLADLTFVREANQLPSKRLRTFSSFSSNTSANSGLSRANLRCVKLEKAVNND